MLRSLLLCAATAVAAAHKGHAGHSHDGHVHKHVSLTDFELPSISAQPFSMDQVTLTPGSRFDIMRSRNLDYLLNLDSSRLACLYTSAANLTGTFNNPTCDAYAHPQYWGHYLGHWLSATAQMYNSTGNAAIRAKSAAMVATLAGAQAAWTSIGLTGYLYPYAISSWDALSNAQNCAPVCVPFYVYHKMVAGMLDQYQLAGNAQAYAVAQAMGLWAKGWVEGVLAKGGQALWQQVLGIEHGGIAESLWNLYAISGNSDYATAASYFNHWSWTAPLAAGQDDLGGNHANTHIPQVIGDIRGYELTGNATKAAIGVNFYNIVTSNHSWATGGSNDHEYWNDGSMMGDQLDSDTEESCTTYNILKVTRHLFGWGANASFADEYERALFNGLVGNQARDEPYGPETNSTGFIYMLPLGGGGLTKPWGSSVSGGFPCCWGTLSETFSKLGDSIYFEAPDHSAVYVNLFVPSTLAWSARGGVQITQTTNFPYDDAATTTITVHAAAATQFDLAVRVPYWAVNANSVTVNGAPVPGPFTPSSYLHLNRTWSDGDVVTVLYTPALRWEPINDQRAQWASVGAVMYGGVLLAGLSETDLLPGLTPANINTFITKTAGNNLTFAAASVCGNITFMPLMDIEYEQYAVYFQTDASSGTVGYNSSGYSTLPGGTNNWGTNGGASIIPNGGDENIRSGDPNEINSAKWLAIVQDASGAGHKITGMSFSFQYVSGYGPAGQHVGTNFSLVSGDSCGSWTGSYWNSGELTQYPFDGCNTCYSPPVNVTVTGLSLDVSQPTSFGLKFWDNDRNVQLKLPIPLTVYWD